ncbi:hypothetical protein [Parabacteroides sp. PF5-9]|uniref:hypothetical protein n=1 Tax=Parabacteroides sp. PF5-9 TaxID=1742404 RepID=UPI002474C505|nr:hypothetical protein [Parabacteroides sp. PF5-9]MDH6358933.1 hypothetical protein [Parabacteroides sp. PF5-9]
MMSFGKFVVVLCTLYFFYYVGMVLWDTIKAKAKSTKSGDAVSFEMNGKGGSSSFIEDETVDVNDEYTEVKKKTMTDKQVASSSSISVGNIEHQGFAVTPDMLSEIRGDVSVLMSSIHF